VIVVSDSGPLIHLASIRQFSLLKRFFHTLHRVPQVYEEVVAQGQGRAGDFEVRQALQDRWLLVGTAPDPAFPTIHRRERIGDGCGGHRLRSHA
jgi:predicted nucleic acid-binding protein